MSTRAYAVGTADDPPPLHYLPRLPSSPSAAAAIAADAGAAAITAVPLQGLDLAKQALTLDPDNFACHKWLAILLSDVGEFDGTKAQLLNAFIMRVCASRV